MKIIKLQGARIRSGIIGLSKEDGMRLLAKLKARDKNPELALQRRTGLCNLYSSLDEDGLHAALTA